MRFDGFNNHTPLELAYAAYIAPLVVEIASTFVRSRHTWVQCNVDVVGQPSISSRSRNHFWSTAVKGFVDNIEKLTTDNEKFRKVLYTGQYMQLVLMTLKPGEEIGAEVHEGHDQFFRVEEGSGEVIIDGQSRAIKDDDAIIVPAGARHNVVNNGDQPLKLYTIYGPPEHRDGVIHATKAQADASDEHFDGKTTE